MIHDPLRISGAELSRQYFFDVGLPVLEQTVPEILPFISIGRVGEGSECFGFDDILSEDHDYGPGFCIWMDDPMWEKYGGTLQDLYWNLPSQFLGYRRPDSGPFLQRVGPMRTSSFYQQFFGRFVCPKSYAEWFSLPQEILYVASNGSLFMSGNSDFLKIRNHLLAYYPEDVRLKKLAGHCGLAGQAGQYNLFRCLKRGETTAALRMLSDFMYHYMAAVFLLNKTYMPPPKWAPHVFSQLPVLGNTAEVLTLISKGSDHLYDCIEDLCHALSQQLKITGLSSSESTFLVMQAGTIQEKIQYRPIKELPLLSWISGWQR